MEEVEQEPFASALTTLLTASPLPLELLYRLSDLAGAEYTEFTSRWLDAAEERRRVIVRHLADISEENFVVDFSAVFIYSLIDPFASVRQAALDGLWDSTDVKLIRPIIGIMQNDENDDVRAAAAAALAHFVLLAEWQQIPAHFSPLIVEALLVEYEKEGTAVPIKRAALEAMGPSGHPRVPELIEEAYEHPQFEMQLSAVFAMGSSADNRWLPIILDEMENPTEEMRAEAARAAGSIGGSVAVETLANLVIDEELSVAVMAVEALGQIGGNQAKNILEGLLDSEEFDMLHEAAAESLEELSLLGGDLEFDWLNVATDYPE